MGQGEAGYADAVRAAREAAGKDPGELAAALDISYESYRDIEGYDDEITSVTTFAEFSLDGLADVAAPLGLDWRHLLPVARRRATRFVEVESCPTPRLCASVPILTSGRDVRRFG